MNENTVVMETVNPVQQVIYIINFCLSCKKFICQFFKTDKIFAPDTEFMTEFILRFFCGKTAWVLGPGISGRGIPKGPRGTRMGTGLS